MTKSSLIDLNAEMPTRAKIEFHNQFNHAERLNEKTPRNGDAIVCSYENNNRKKPAEMAGSLQNTEGVTKRPSLQIRSNQLLN